MTDGLEMLEHVGGEDQRGAMLAIIAEAGHHAAETVEYALRVLAVLDDLDRMHERSCRHEPQLAA